MTKFDQLREWRNDLVKFATRFSNLSSEDRLVRELTETAVLLSIAADKLELAYGMSKDFWDKLEKEVQ